MATQDQNNSKKKEKFFNLSSNEWVNDPVTHFMKSGNRLRADENKRLSEVAQFIPKQPNGVKIEYDINYGSPPNTIAGYKFTDLLTQMLYIAPCNSDIATKNMVLQIRKGPTDEGFRILNLLKENLTDKYMLDDDIYNNFSEVNNLIILPGTNLLTKDAVNWDKIDKLYSEGAWIKLHPITAKVWVTMLSKKYKERIISNDVSLYPIMKKAKTVYFTTSSETGISSVLLGKGIGVINNNEAKIGRTFEAVYNSLDRCGVKDKLINKFAALLSHPESGLISCHHTNKKECVDRFFNNMKQYKHIVKQEK